MEATRREALRALLATGVVPLLATPVLADPLAPGVGLPGPSTPSPVAPTPTADGEDQAPGSVAGARSRFDHLTAPVTLNGSGPYPFIVDTGASISCVSHDLVQSLGLPIRPGRRVHTIVGAKLQPMAVVDELRIGVRRQRRMSALALKLVQPGIGGVLAVDWLRGQRVTLDFAESRLAFEPSRAERSAPGVVVVPARRRHGQLTIVDADLGTRRISAMIDSGSQLSLCNSALLALLDRRATRPPERRRIEMVTIIGEPFSGELVMLPFLRLGGLQMGDVPVVRSDSHVFEIWDLADKPTVLLGMDLLRQFRAVSLDFGRSQVRFDLPRV